MANGYPAITAKDPDGNIAGFGMLRAYNPLSVFSKTAEITYFIKPAFTGIGLGKKMLDYLVTEGKKIGLTSILASISSRNEGSIRFHEKNGFSKCGCFKNIGIKNNQSFDVVWMQMSL